jgi:hypothetical protein
VEAEGVRGNIQAAALESGDIRELAAVFYSRKISCIEDRPYRNKIVPLVKNNNRNIFPSDDRPTVCNSQLQIGRDQEVSPVLAAPAR